MGDIGERVQVSLLPDDDLKDRQHGGAKHVSIARRPIGSAPGALQKLVRLVVAIWLTQMEGRWEMEDGRGERRENMSKARNSTLELAPVI